MSPITLHRINTRRKNSSLEMRSRKTCFWLLASSLHYLMCVSCMQGLVDILLGSFGKIDKTASARNLISETPYDFLPKVQRQHFIDLEVGQYIQY